MPSTCFVGRMVFRSNHHGELDWETPCPVPAEETMFLDPEPPMYFCAPHFQAIADTLYDAYERVGLINHSIVAGPESDEDELAGAWERSSLGNDEQAAQRGAEKPEGSNDN